MFYSTKKIKPGIIYPKQIRIRIMLVTKTFSFIAKKKKIFTSKTNEKWRILCFDYSLKLKLKFHKLVQNLKWNRDNFYNLCDCLAENSLHFILQKNNKNYLYTICIINNIKIF